MIIEYLLLISLWDLKKCLFSFLGNSCPTVDLKVYNGRFWQCKKNQDKKCQNLLYFDFNIANNTFYLRTMIIILGRKYINKNAH